MKEKLATAIVGTSHGIKGFVKVHPYSDDFKKFLDLSTVTLKRKDEKKEVQIEECQLYKDCVLVHFKGYDNPEIAKTLNGFVVWIDRNQAAPLKDGENYVADLIGLDVIHDGQSAGKISGCMEGLQGLLLEIRTEDGDHFIPYIDRYFGKVDLASGTIELKEIMLLS